MQTDNSQKEKATLHYRENPLKYWYQQKGGGRMEEMTEKELITILIDQYTDLQRIKKANADTKNAELDYQLKVTVAKLSTLGVSVEDITL